MRSTKPPIGVMPKHIWDERRLSDLCQAITRYCNADLVIDIEWIKEYNELIKTNRVQNNNTAGKLSEQQPCECKGGYCYATDKKGELIRPCKINT